MPHFFSKRLNGTLKEVLREAIEQSSEETFNLVEEVTLARQSVLNIITVYEAALETGSIANIELAAIQMRSALAEVASLVSQAAALDAQRKDKISAHNIDFVCAQIVRIAYEVFGDDVDEALLEQFRVSIRDKLRVETKPGTSITPDQDVSEMDDTIPAVALIEGEVA